ncbi:DUF5979 domain-containing protein [Leucobacter allii]|uniref:DUF5979 domain-containing protein n=1 Tax=Leucobacter allii TaxID=2932247 RepID=A0ABY4FP22_9MICO|nr:SdrD B-like domain-containing protein [Leucobacter allii]UOQ58040.1 DUF5979 domain-containing protein [Leucobacter allii]
MPQSHHRRPGRTSRGALALAAAVVAAVVVGLCAAPAQAVSQSGLRSTELYAYAEAGDAVGFSFANSQGVEVRSPDGAVAASCPSGACAGEIPSALAGVWVVRYTAETDNTTAWTLQVADASGTAIPGRVWAESVNFSNTGFGSRTFSATYLSEFGGMYSAQFTGHRGWVFSLRASNRGVMFNDGSCLPAYRSVPMSGVVEAADGALPAISGDDYLLDSPACRDNGLVFYRIFLGETPDPAMPASTALWGDGRTSQQWVLPPYQTPEITDLQYARDGFTAAGTVTGTLSGQPGVIRLRIDTDANGVFTDAVDVEFDTAAATGGFSIPWDGRDGAGDAVPPGRGFAVEAEFLGESEIHFLEGDVEGRSGGIRVTRMNGPDAPDSRVSWNDGLLPGIRATTTTPLIGDRVDSAAGAHAWEFNGNGWGNARIVDDWMTIASGSARVALPVDGLPVLRLGELVWYDADQNGRQDPDEPGIPGVTVSVLAADGTVLGTTATDAMGIYAFEGLNASTAARVSFDVSTADVTGLADAFGVASTAQLAFTTQHAPDAAPELDSDVDPGTGESALPGTAGSADIRIDAGLVAHGHLTIAKTVAGPAPAGFAFGFTARCTDFRGASSEHPFNVKSGERLALALPAGMECAVEETEPGGASAVQYAVDGAELDRAPTLTLSPAAGTPELVVTNTFAAPPSTPGDATPEQPRGSVDAAGGPEALSVTGGDARLPLLFGGALLALGGALLAMISRSRGRRHEV